MSWRSYATCDFCGDTVKSAVANTYQCPTCRRKEKTCTSCGETKPIHDGENYLFAYNWQKDSLDFDNPFNDICQKCQQAKAKAVVDDQKKSAKLKLSEAQLAIIECIKAGITDNKKIAEKLEIKVTSLRALKSKTKKTLEQNDITWESYPDVATGKEL